MRNRSCLACQFDSSILFAHNGNIHQSVLTIFLSIAKAFGHVSRSRILTKIRTYGITNALLSWLRSYPSDGCQVVEMRSAWSHPCPIKGKVTQSIHLASYFRHILPIFFMAHHACLIMMLKLCTTLKFALSTSS